MAAFYHPLFLRGQKHLAERILLGDENSNPSLDADDSQPDFSTMPVLSAPFLQPAADPSQLPVVGEPTLPRGSGLASLVLQSVIAGNNLPNDGVFFN